MKKIISVNNTKITLDTNRDKLLYKTNAAWFDSFARGTDLYVHKTADNTIYYFFKWGLLRSEKNLIQVIAESEAKKFLEEKLSNTNDFKRCERDLIEKLFPELIVK